MPRWARFPTRCVAPLANIRNPWSFDRAFAVRTMSPVKLILASASPRRAEILRAAGIPFEVRPTHLDESLHAAESPGDYVRRLALEKARAAANERIDWVDLSG